MEKILIRVLFVLLITWAVSAKAGDILPDKVEGTIADAMTISKFSKEEVCFSVWMINDPDWKRTGKYCLEYKGEAEKR